MRTLFTIHAGEFLVGEQIGTVFKKNVNVWIPAKDTGIDLLLTDKSNKKVVSLQVKFSRDYVDCHIELKKLPRAGGWFKIVRERLANSTADFWILVLLAIDRKTTDYLILSPKQLLKCLNAIHGEGSKVIQCYIQITNTGQCWETRGLHHHDKVQISADEFENADRDLTRYLNQWEPINQLLK
jgi:hypothetical protein